MTIIVSRTRTILQMRHRQRSSRSRHHSSLLRRPSRLLMMALLLLSLLSLLLLPQSPFPIAVVDAQSVSVPFFVRPTAAAGIPTTAPAMPILAPTSTSTTTTPLTAAPSVAPVVATATKPPTKAPTKAPTKVPTKSPTMTPTTPRPSASPSTETPTIGPTITPTAEPSPGPTISPMPTSETFMPTISRPPTSRPTLMMTIAPAVSTLNTTLNVVFRMTELSSPLDDANGNSRTDFEIVVANFIKAALTSNNDVDTATTNAIQIVNVGAAIYGQDLLMDGQQRRRQQRHRRKLLPLRVGINVIVEYIDNNDTNGGDERLDLLIGTAFDNDVKRDSFLRNLQRKNPTAFTTVTTVTVWVNGQIPIETSSPPPPTTNNGNNGGSGNGSGSGDSDDGLATWIILLAAIGGGVVFLAALIIIFIVLRRSSSSSTATTTANRYNQYQHQQQYTKPTTMTGNKKMHQQYGTTMPTSTTMPGKKLSSSQHPQPQRYNNNNNNTGGGGGGNRNGGRNGGDNDNDNDNNTFLYDQPTLPYSAEILLENRADDVSTLGDPVGMASYAVQQQLGRDERTASFGGDNDYDYAKHKSSLLGRQHSSDVEAAEAPAVDPYRRTGGGAPSSSSLGVGGFVVADDNEFEQQFELTMDTERRLEFVVPPGKLGMIIDTPDDGPPLVHAVKAGSILDGKVQVGDLLMAVDDQNVTDWSAVQVSKFIAARSDRRRTLVFWRQHARKRTESSIQLEGDGV